MNLISRGSVPYFESWAAYRWYNAHKATDTYLKLKIKRARISSQVLCCKSPITGSGTDYVPQWWLLKFYDILKLITSTNDIRWRFIFRLIFTIEWSEVRKTTDPNKLSLCSGSLCLSLEQVQFTDRMQASVETCDCSGHLLATVAILDQVSECIS